MRKISANEVKKTSLVFSEIFKDYYAYDIFFPRDGKQRKKIYYFYRYEVYAAKRYTYVFDDGFGALCCVKKPGDKDSNPSVQFLNPFFAIAFFATCGIKAIRLAGEYMKFAEKISARHYNPNTDSYIKNVGVAENMRGKGMLKKMLSELCGDMPIYLETHLDENVVIYEKLGFKVVAKEEWHGITHYAMKREGRE